MEFASSCRERMSSLSSSNPRSSSSQVLHMGWLQHRVPSLLFTVWQPRFCVLKQSSEDVVQLHIYKTDDTINGVLLSSIYLEEVIVHEYHERTKIGLVLEVLLPSGGSALFAMSNAKSYKTWMQHLKRSGVLIHIGKRQESSPAKPKDAKHLERSSLKLDASASGRCLETFMTASFKSEEPKSKTTMDLETKLHACIYGDEVAIWSVNGEQVKSLPHFDILHEISPFGWIWKVLEVYTASAETTTFRWKSEGYFTGSYHDCLGDGQLVLQEGFGHFHPTQDTQPMRLELFYNPNALIDGLSSYASRVKSHRLHSTNAA